MGSAASFDDGNSGITSQREDGAKTRRSRRWNRSLEPGVSNEDLEFKLHYYRAISLIVKGQ